MGFKANTPSLQGVNYYKINWSPSNRAYVFRVTGCGSSAGFTVDVEIHHGRGVHEGRTLPFHRSAGFAYWYDGDDMYLELTSYMSVMITSIRPMTIEHVDNLPSTATKVVLS